MQRESDSPTDLRLLQEHSVPQEALVPLMKHAAKMKCKLVASPPAPDIQKTTAGVDALAALGVHATAVQPRTQAFRDFQRVG
eukprot:15432756-Alexandrium_andersonii.AAC.1